jgi:serine/threonine protein kinase
MICSPDQPVATDHELSPTLLSYTRQVALGLMYLSFKKFVHRDIAARNILVNDEGICKVK